MDHVLNRMAVHVADMDRVHTVREAFIGVSRQDEG